MKTIRILIALVSLSAITGIGGAFTTNLDDFAKKEKLKVVVKERKIKDKEQETETLSEEQVQEGTDITDDYVESNSSDISNDASSVKSDKVVNNSSSTTTQKQQTQVNNSNAQASQPVQQPTNQIAPTHKVDCSIPLFDGDYVDFTNYNDVLNFKNRVNTEVGGKISWRDVVGKCGTTLGYRVEVYVNGQTYSKSSYESSF